MQFSSLPPLVLTNCTGRKRQGNAVVRFPNGRRATCLRSMATMWRTALQSSPDRYPARSLYAGRSIHDALKASSLAGGELLVVSAGVGLVHEDDLVPAYDLTVVEESGDLAKALSALDSTASEWWAELGSAGVGRGPIAEFLRARPTRKALIALPSGYLEMVSADLDSLRDSELKLLRIFTSPAGAAALPPRLHSSLMPYDTRLESLPGHAGTRADFPQRAMRHFVESLNAHRLDLASARRAVEQSLQGLPKRQTPIRTRLSDEAIAQLLEANWHAHGGSSTRLLRFVRREAGVACEQRRFRDIWRGVRAGHSDRRDVG